MILEEETFREFGYYPSDLKPQSGKKILAACDECGKVRITSKNVYRALCLSCSQKGRKNPNYGKHHSEETKRKMRGRTPWNKGIVTTEETKQKIREANSNPSEETRKKMREAHKGQVPWNKGLKGHNAGEKNPMFGRTGEKCPAYGRTGEKHPMWGKRGEENPNFGKHPTEEARQKIREARKRRIFPTHHTKPELIFENISKNNNVPSLYVGDGALWIGKKGGEQHNPDFIIKVNGKRYVVEIDGEYWHSPLLNHRLKERRTVTHRKRFYRKHKWIPIFIWDRDLLREDAEAFVLNILRENEII